LEKENQVPWFRDDNHANHSATVSTGVAQAYNYGIRAIKNSTLAGHSESVYPQFYRINAGFFLPLFHRLNFHTIQNKISTRLKLLVGQENCI